MEKPCFATGGFSMFTKKIKLTHGWAWYYFKLCLIYSLLDSQKGWLPASGNQQLLKIEYLNGCVGPSNDCTSIRNPRIRGFAKRCYRGRPWCMRQMLGPSWPGRGKFKISRHEGRHWKIALNKNRSRSSLAGTTTMGQLNLGSALGL